MEKVKIVYAHHHGDKIPGDEDELPVDEASRLVRGGRANYATAAAAKAAEGDAGADKTVAKRGAPKT